MSDDNNIVDFAIKFKEKTDNNKYKHIPPEIMQEIENNLKPEDYQAFFRVLETIRSIGDETSIVASKQGIDFTVTQYPEEAVEVPDTFAMKNVEITQRVAFDCSPLVDLDFSEEEIATYIVDSAEQIRESIISLIYWHDGSIHEDEGFEQ